MQIKTEPILCYRMNAAENIFELEQADNKKNYPHQGKFGKCRFEIIEKSDAGNFSRPTMKFKILGQFPREGKRWQIGEETARQLEKNGRFEIVDGIVKKAFYPEDEEEKINSSVTFEQLANFVWFSATKTPYLEQKNSPLLGVYDGKAIYLLYNGILKDKSVKGGNILTKKILSSLPKCDGEKIIYGSACRIDEKFLEENKITFRQIPKELNL